ncbi:RNA polymerase sigma factor [Aminipila terrae]|uniref:Sigma-70 family RNA polymerase sigma factor n=1 Tax=Aminipila terrae TaxID=2697030 RepID=A0A6P1MRD7_9FIRM|nr:sigma-70 family RNA polymerase sigma factor [Aminipila terrae]QHI73565.1 sigma-70 family RNA polymerase sigma factor [Aminipila terrae]
MKTQSFNSDDCIELVVKRYTDMVYRLAFAQTRNKSDADDIFQEVFMRYIRKKPEFQTEEHRKAWLIRVTINCSKKLWASAWKRKTEGLDESAIFQEQDEKYLYLELKKLPVRYRAVIHLFYYEDLSIEEISKILKRKPSTVRTQLTRGRYKLKEILKEEYDV